MIDAWRMTRSLREREAVMALAVALPLGALLLGFYRGRQPGSRKRSMSFGSGYMSIGSWPKDIKMPDPAITAFMFLDGIPRQADLEEACSKMLLFQNFKALPVRRRWCFSTRFDWHDIEVQPSDVITWAKAAGSASVLAEMDRVKDTPFRQATFDGRSLPMWGLHVIENTAVEEAGFGTVLVFRVHHSLGDGMSMVAVSRSVLEAAGGGEVGMSFSGCRDGSTAADAVVKPTNRGLSSFSTAKILSGVRQVMALSTAGPDNALPFGHFEVPLKGDGAAAAHRPQERGVLGNKRVAYSGRRRTILLPDLPLVLIKKIKDASATTVNDVVMSLVSGCIRRHSEAQGTAPESIEGPRFQSRSLIPVALPRPSSFTTALCNKWAFVSMSLSMEESDPVTRLQKLKATTAELKTNAAAGLQYFMQTYAMPYIPLWICREMLYVALAKHTVTVSNVPGPQEPVKIAGIGLRKVHFAFSNVMPQVDVISIDGKMAVNFIVDPLSVPDSQTLPTHFLDELEALANALGVQVSEEMSHLRTQADAIAVVMEAALTAPAASYSS
ncbi:unnamed protein product [Pylaiella littoralis]